MKQRKTKKLLDEVASTTGKKKLPLKESSYYSNGSNGSSETASAYEFAKDSVPTLNKIEALRDQKARDNTPEALPYPFQDSVKQLADLYLMAQDLRNKSREASKLPLFKGKQSELDEFRKKLNGVMVECKKLAANLSKFSLAPRR